MSNRQKDFRFIKSSAMKFHSTTIIIFFCAYQLAFVTAPNPDGPCKEDEANAYVQSVQDFWTDERLAQAKPKPMSIDPNNDINSQSPVSEGEVKKLYILIYQY